MKIVSLSVANLFCYRSEQRFDLSTTDDEPIVLIHGRNGQGKTSLLNSLKLLFSGVSEDRRREALRGAKLQQREYVNGRDQWMGIIHRHARAPGTEARVQAILEAAQVGRVSVSRTWRVGRTGAVEDWEGTLCYEALSQKGGQVEEGGAAATRLAAWFPSFAIPFFLFDGEQVQEMAADDPAMRKAAVQRLLGLEPFKRTRDAVRVLRRQWDREIADGSSEAEILDIEGKLKRNAAERKRTETQLGKLERELSDVIRDQQEQKERDHTLGLSTSERDELLGQLKALDADLAASEREIALDLAIFAPLVLNPAPIRSTLDALRRLQGSADGEAQLRMLRQMLNDLPHEVFAREPLPEPPLTPAQRAAYSARLTRAIEGRMPAAPVGNLSIPPAERQFASEQLEAKLQDEAARQNTLESLRSYLESLRRRDEVVVRLEDMEELSDREQRERRAIRDGLDALAKREGAIREEQKQLKEREQTLRAEDKRLERELTDAERRARQQSQFSRRADLARRSEAMLDELIGLMASKSRETLSAETSKHLTELLSSNNLIQKVLLTEDFDHEFFDARGVRVGSGSVSAGMKQLFAMAFLWALKDASGWHLPMAIDTPLARLDREHQDRLIEGYFPRINPQLILLPTNSELDRAKYERLRPYVSREYRLESASGDDTRVIGGEGARMYPAQGNSR